MIYYNFADFWTGFAFLVKTVSQHEEGFRGCAFRHRTNNCPLQLGVGVPSSNDRICFANVNTHVL